MIRRAGFRAPPARGRGAAAVPVLLEQIREVKYSTIQESLQPVPGRSAGTLSMINDICVNPDTDEENKRPAWRLEVAPKAEEKTYLNTMWKWGYNSLSLFRKVNESAGPWWNANNTTLTSNWSQIGEYCNAGFWCGIWRYTYGLGQFNQKPGQLYGKTWGNIRSKKGEVRVDYKEVEKEETQKLVYPHTEEHKRHNRIVQASNGATVIQPVHAKRCLREMQYQLAQGLRYYMIDGVFGSHPATGTTFRVVTDNPNSAYFSSISAIRNRNISSQEEFVLLKRLGEIPLDEWTWRRPSVLMYHCPSYDFELPRIVEEFGGPRPQDLGLTSPRFTLTDPYSIPMKCLIAAQPSSGHLLDSIAVLAGRWGYYADDKKFLTVAGDSILTPDGKNLTVFISNGRVDTDRLRASPQLYGARHHRIANGLVSRAWESTSFKEGTSGVAAAKGDYVEESLGSIVHRPLPLHVGKVDGVAYRSHRFKKNQRHIADWGYKLKHSYTSDPKVQAAAAGLLFGAKSLPAQSFPRPSAMHLNSVTFVVVKPGDGALQKLDDSKSVAQLIVEGLAASNTLYAEAEPLAATFAEAMQGASACYSVGEKSAAGVVEKLAQSYKL